MTETDKAVWRCDVTGNPVGTDTVMIGAPPCDCQGCRAAAALLATKLDATMQIANWYGRADKACQAHEDLQFETMGWKARAERAEAELVEAGAAINLQVAALAERDKRIAELEEWVKARLPIEEEVTAEVTRLRAVLSLARDVVDASLENRPSYSWAHGVRAKIDAALGEKP